MYLTCTSEHCIAVLNVAEKEALVSNCLQSVLVHLKQASWVINLYSADTAAEK